MPGVNFQVVVGPSVSSALPSALSRSRCAPLSFDGSQHGVPKAASSASFCFSNSARAASSSLRVSDLQVMAYARVYDNQGGFQPGFEEPT